MGIFIRASSRRKDIVREMHIYDNWVSSNAAKFEDMERYVNEVIYGKSKSKRVEPKTDLRKVKSDWMRLAKLTGNLR